MDGPQPLDDLEADVRGPRHGEDLFAAQQVPQGPRFEQLHHDPDLVVGLDLVVDRHHVLVLDLGDGLRLAPRALQRGRLRGRGHGVPVEQALHGDEPAEPQVVGLPDLAHPAAADRFQQLVAAVDHGPGEGGAPCGGVLGHSGGAAASGRRGSSPDRRSSGPRAPSPALPALSSLCIRPPVHYMDHARLDAPSCSDALTWRAGSLPGDRRCGSGPVTGSRKPRRRCSSTTGR